MPAAKVEMITEGPLWETLDFITQVGLELHPLGILAPSKAFPFAFAEPLQILPRFTNLFISPLPDSAPLMPPGLQRLPS